jgi:hypothetical protein
MWTKYCEILMCSSFSWPSYRHEVITYSLKWFNFTKRCFENTTSNSMHTLFCGILWKYFCTIPFRTHGISWLEDWKTLIHQSKTWMLFKIIVITFLCDSEIYLGNWMHWPCLMKFPLFPGSLTRFANFAKTNGLKAILAIGGWNEGSVKYSEVCHLC